MCCHSHLEKFGCDPISLSLSHPHPGGPIVIGTTSKIWWEGRQKQYLEIMLTNNSPVK